jgi:hypothetical protein
VPADGIKPTFTERPVIRQTEDGGKVSFECRLVGDPKPTVTWLVLIHFRYCYYHSLIREINGILALPL